MASQANGLEDVLIPGAAAGVSRDGLAYLRFTRLAIPTDQLICRQHQAGRAVAALQAVRFPKGFLDWMERSIFCKSFDRQNLSSVGLHGEHRARFHNRAIHQYGARSAVGGVTT